MSQQVFVKFLRERRFAGFVANVRLDSRLHQPVSVVQHGDELAELVVKERERDQPATDARHGYCDRVEDLHDGGHHANIIRIVTLIAVGRVVNRWRQDVHVRIGREN